ncbi:MAG: hypothetical protein ACRCVJ_15325 [Clostridium sp.]|uniref:hypothetical protein n=1 Tax=Clostridium sp. TaxID=1506 RepID=UPI003F36443C
MKKKILLYCSDILIAFNIIALLVISLFNLHHINGLLSMYIFLLFGLILRLACEFIK